MDIAEVLKLANDLMFAKTGKHLDYLQEAIVRGTLQGQKYSEIAQETHSSEGHIRDVGSELWRILSDLLGEEISKSNFRAKIEKSLLCNVALPFGKKVQRIGKINIFPEKVRSPTTTQQPQQTSPQPQIDLGDAPEIFTFYDRTTSLTTLENWILQERTRLIALLGISGIGKTTLSLRLIEQIKNLFDYVIYRSLRFSPTLDATLTNLLQIFSPQSEISQNIETQLSQLLNYLRKHRCLIVFDDVHTLFSSGQLAGQYRSGYENYQLFFKLITEVTHNSCLILNSWEKPREVAQLKKENNSMRSLVLVGLEDAAKEILREQELSDEDFWETLIDTYQGNPLWLEFTAYMIKELFAGRVSEFLQCDTLILSELQAQLDRQFQRLTQQELAVMTQLASEDKPVSLSHLIKKIQLPTSELLNAMQSLGRRLLLDAKDQDKTTFFTLNPVLKQYVKLRACTNHLPARE